MVIRAFSVGTKARLYPTVFGCIAVCIQLREQCCVSFSSVTQETMSYVCAKSEKTD